MTTIAPHLAASGPALKSASKTTRINGLAAMSVVFGVLQYVVLFIPCWLVTIPFGVHALQQTAKGDTTSKGAAIAGLALSVTHFAIYAFVFIWLLTTQ
jgi:hypothetical protein